jgi:hypothetical protein
MTKQQFNIAVAERVMGWETRIVPTVQSSSGYLYDSDDSHIYCPGPDFADDHNAAALVRARVAELEGGKPFIEALVDATQGAWREDSIGFVSVWFLLRATPAQTARAAYVAVTGEELEAVDE